ncbi:acyl-CoA N-acyltransferase, partial [Panus rudis PR-1116 ss-1]
TDYVTPRSPKFNDTIRRWFNEDLFHAIIYTSQERFVGFVTIQDCSPKNRDGDLAITLHPKPWDEGYGTEVLNCVVAHCFRALNLHRVSVGFLDTNERAVKLYKKLYWVRGGGRIRKADWVDGAWRDEILMGISKEEWIEQYSGASTS